MKAPPNGKGGLPAAFPPVATSLVLRLARQLKAVNSTAPKPWTAEGWRLLNLYLQTGEARHLAAAECHIAATLARTWGSPS